MKIGKYKIAGLLGTGGMGRVYRAILPDIEKIVALKLLSPHPHLTQLLGNDEVRRLFIREASLLSGLRDSNIATVLDFDRDVAGRPFFTMEYFSLNLGLLIGETYRLELPTRILPPQIAARYILQILSGLDRLHHEGILHRDIKPYNIMITESDEVRLIDFGLSAVRGEGRAMPDNLKIGSPYYTAPEQEENPDDIDARADVYSAGVVLWRMLTGTLPPETGKPPLPSALNPVLGNFWDDCLLKATQPDPGRRFNDCRAMRLAVEKSLRDWISGLDKTCGLNAASVHPGRNANAGDSPLRSTPVKVNKSDAPPRFGLDPLYRPVLIKTPVFEYRGEDILEDCVHGLIWQKSGNRYPCDHKTADKYIEELNRTVFSGIKTWRLPTVDELCTLVKPRSALGDFCADPLFDTLQDRIWSSDRCTFITAWFVDMGLGFVGEIDMYGLCHVRAVSGAKT